jgi:hypothetical protein
MITRYRVDDYHVVAQFETQRASVRFRCRPGSPLVRQLKRNPFPSRPTLSGSIKVDRLTYEGRFEAIQLPFILDRGYCRQTHSAN